MYTYAKESKSDKHDTKTNETGDAYEDDGESGGEPEIIPGSNFRMIVPKELELHMVRAKRV